MGNAAAIKPALSTPPIRKPGRRKPPIPLFPLILMLLLLAVGIKRGVQMSREYIEGTEGHVYIDEEGNPEVVPEIYEPSRVSTSKLWNKRLLLQGSIGQHLPVQKTS